MTERPFPDPRFPRHAALWPIVESRLPPAELAHDRRHIERVYRWALELAPEASAPPELAGATALVHDLEFVPKDSPDRAEGGERSARAAKDVLKDAGYAAEEVAAITEAVRTSSWSRGLSPTNALGAVLQDADRLDAIGAVGVLRTAATGQFMSKPERPGAFYDSNDPFGRNGRVLDDRRFVLDHFQKKLNHLAHGMHTETAKREAALRHAAMTAFLSELAREIGA